MKTTVNLLVTVRKPEMLPAALLVFKTIRVGFPTAGIQVWGNGLTSNFEDIIRHETAKVGGTFLGMVETSHGEWIERLTKDFSRAFWICDTDVVFFDLVEDWFDPWGNVAFAGRYEPAFRCDWTGATHVSRLHPSLMFINPAKVHEQTRAWPGKHPFFNTAHRNFYQWHWVPRRERVLAGDRADHCELCFYDTTAGLFQALGGTAFTEQQNAAFEHLYCSTYLDLIGKTFPEDFTKMHEMVYNNPEAARGLHEKQRHYYLNKQPITLTYEHEASTIKTV